MICSCGHERDAHRADGCTGNGATLDREYGVPADEPCVCPLRFRDGCPACGRDIDRLGGNPNCETCAAEPTELELRALYGDR